MAHILIAEDEICLAHQAALHCQIWGHTVAIAPDGEEALEMLGRERFDLIVLDARLPFLDGIILAHILRHGGTHRSLPILGLSALPEEGPLLREEGVEVVLDKPYQPETLKGAIERALGSSRAAS